jgi:uncharacterized membrane protein YkvA (DUF1232 family)
MQHWKKAFGNAKRSAELLLQNPENTSRLIDSALELSSSVLRNRKFSLVFSKLQTATRMIRSYLRKEYRDVPWKTILLLTAALVYFVSPVDALPDFIPIIGYADDVALITAVFASIGNDLEKFLKWEQSAIQEPEVACDEEH